MNFLILLTVFGALAYRIVPAADRTRYLSAAIALYEEVKTAFTTKRPQYEAFKDALRARTPHVIVAPALVALNAARSSSAPARLATRQRSSVWAPASARARPTASGGAC